MKNQKGMTLVEILVAMGLMVMVVFCFTPFMLSSLQNVQVAGDQRENLYTQKGDIEEQISEGIDAEMTEELDGVAVDFTQNGRTFTGTANGLYLTSDMLTSFIARDEGELDISPGSVSENYPSNRKITITCDFMEFLPVDDGGKEFKLLQDDQPVSWVTFEILDSHRAVMSAAPDYQFDIKEPYKICYGEVSATLHITPSSLIAVGQDGAYYVYTSQGTWKAGNGIDGNKLGENTLRDAIWTGTQYVTAGDEGSWFYTVNGAGWDSENLTTSDSILKLESYEGKIYASGYFTTTFMWWTNYFPFESILDDPADVEPGDAGFWENVFGTKSKGSAVAVGPVNGKVKEVWAISASESSDGEIHTTNSYDTELVSASAIADMCFNMRSGSESDEENRGEVVAVSKNDGKIYHSFNLVEWPNNGDVSAPTKELNPDKPERTFYRYVLANGDNLEVDYDENNPEPLEVTRDGKEYYINYQGTQYQLSGATNSCTLRKETYYIESTVNTTGVMNTVSFGEWSDSAIWVIGGGDITLNETQTNSMEATVTQYSYDTDKEEWVIDGDAKFESIKDTPVVTPTKNRIIWRDANDYEAGQWKIARVPEGCTTINDIEFIGGKFYAVGDGGWILVSEDGQKWDRMRLNDGATYNFYGIAGWGDDWGTD